MSLLSKIIIITAPSGTGKTTINRRLVKELETLEFSVSHTTRPKRPGEENGAHYWFVERHEFENLINHGKMLEWADVFGKLYGTGYSELERLDSDGKSLLLEIDVQGWQSVRNKISGLCSIFILPPSLSELWSRLEKRGTESTEVIQRRFQTARDEIKIGLGFENFVINDDLERTYQLIKDFLLGTGTLPLSTSEGRQHCYQLLKEFETFKPSS